MSDRVDSLLRGETIEAPPPTSSRVNELLRGDFSRPTELRADTEELPDLSPGTIAGYEYRKGLKPASFGAHFQTGFVDETRTKINIYAKSRGMDPNRYGIDKHTGEIYFIGEDGYAHFETPDGFMQKAKRFIAETAADPSIPLATVLATMGPWWSALGAAGGEGWRKIIGSLVYKEPQTIIGNIGGMAIAGGTGYLGEKVGTRIIRGIDRTKGKTGKTLLELAGTERYHMNPAQVKRIDMLSKKYKIDLFVPQTTKSRELIAQFNLLGDLPVTADKIGEAKLKQFGQINKSINDWLDSFAAKTTTPGEAGRRGVEAAQATISKAQATRAAKARPMYEKAFKEAPEVDIEPIIGFIKEELKTAKGNVRAGLLKAQKLLEKPDLPKIKEGLVSPTGQPLTKEVSRETSLKGLHDAKIALDDEIAKARKARTQNVARNYQKTKEMLLEQMDAASQDYKTARRIYSEESLIPEELGKTKIGQLAKLEGDRVEKAAGVLFSPSQSSPEIISIAKEAIVRESGEDAWNALLRTHLKQKFRDVVKSGTENIGGMLRKKIWMDIDQREILEAAMTKAQKQDFSDFMEVLESTGLTAGRESTSIPRLVSVSKMQEEAGGIPGKIQRWAGHPMVSGKRLIYEWRLKMRTEKYQEMLADAMISGKATKQIQNMLKLTPGSQQLIKAISTFMTLVGKGEYSRERERKRRETITPQLEFKGPTMHR